MYVPEKLLVCIQVPEEDFLVPVLSFSQLLRLLPLPQPDLSGGQVFVGVGQSLKYVQKQLILCALNYNYRDIQ